MNDAIEKAIMNTTVEKFTASPKITSIDWENDNLHYGTVHASFTFGDRIFNISPQVHINYVDRVFSAKDDTELLDVLNIPKQSFRNETVTFQPDEKMKMLSALFTINLNNFVENGFFVLFKIKLAEVKEIEKVKLSKEAKTEWEMNTFVHNLPEIKKNGGDIVYDTLEKYQAEVLARRNVFKLSATFKKNVEGQDITFCITKHESYRSYRLKSMNKDLYLFSHYSECSRPMSFANALKRVQERMESETNRIILAKKFTNSRESVLAEFTKKLNDAGIKFTEYSKTDLVIYNDYITMGFRFEVISGNCFIEGLGGKYPGYGSTRSSASLVFTIDEVISLFNDVSLKIFEKNAEQKFLKMIEEQKNAKQKE